MSAALALEPAAFQSRCTFYCVRCARTGSRTESFHPREPTVADASHFFDRCPNCGSTDVEVHAPVYRHASHG